MATPIGTAAAARQAASGYALRALPRSERLTPLPGTSTMFLAAPPEFDAVLGVLDVAERTLNAP